MIATCPHCQSGFYIASDLAGAVVTCSKCKKQVRAPNRRGVISPSEQANDGIPTAMLAETRVEVEERLKTETEGRFEAEKQIKDIIEARRKAEEQSKVDSQARQEAEARLKTEVGARAAIEAKLLTETQAMEKAEEEAIAAKQARDELEEKLKVEAEEWAKAQAQAQTMAQNLADIEAKLKDAVRTAREMELKLKDEEVAGMKAESRADSEAESRARLEQQWKTEKEAIAKAEIAVKTKADSQAKAEGMAKRKIQSQMADEIKAREKAEKELAAAKANLRSAEVAALVKEPLNFNRGLMRLTVVLSLVTTWLSGWFAYRNGYVIWSRFDRPVRLPWFEEPVFLPIVLIAFCVAGFVAAWAAYLVAIFIIRGFRRPTLFGNMKRHHKPKPEVMTEELIASDEHKMWRSS